MLFLVVLVRMTFCHVVQRCLAGLCCSCSAVVRLCFLLVVITHSITSHRVVRGRRRRIGVGPDLGKFIGRGVNPINTGSDTLVVGSRAC